MSNSGMDTTHTTPSKTDPSRSGAPVLRVHGLRFAYPDRPLLSDWSADILPGVTLVRGGDGCGKTTLLRLLAGALPAQAGDFQLGEVSLAQAPDAYRRQVFWAESRSDAFDQMTVEAYLNGRRTQDAGFDAAVLDELVAGLGLQEHLHKQLFMLSTGSKRKVWLAAAMASGALLTLLDEPFAALDKPSIVFVLGQLTVAARQNRRAWVIADYEAPEGLSLSGLLDLGD